MIKQVDGTYKWEKTDVILLAGNIEFKVVKDHDWGNGSWPSSNYMLNIAETAKYTVTITFNPNATENNVAAVVTKTGDAQVDPTVELRGAWNNWSEGIAFTLSADKTYATMSRTYTKGDYQFKIVLNGGDWRSNNKTFTREESSAADMTGNLDNMTLSADTYGEYIFKWTFATNTLEITFPEKGQEPNFYIAGNMTNWANDKIAVFGDSYTFENLEGGTKIHLLKVVTVADEWKGFDDLTDKSGLVGDIDNNIAFVLLPLPNAKVTVTYKENVFTVTGNFIPMPAITDGYYWCGTNLDWFVTTLTTPGASLDNYLFKANEHADGEFYLNAKLTAGEEMKIVKIEGNALRAYYPNVVTQNDDNFVIDEAHAGQKDIYFRPNGNEYWTEFYGILYIEPNETTGLDNNAESMKAVKIFRNGEIYILKGDKIYTITGQLVW